MALACIQTHRGQLEKPKAPLPHPLLLHYLITCGFFQQTRHFCRYIRVNTFHNHKKPCGFPSPFAKIPIERLFVRSIACKVRRDKLAVSIFKIDFPISGGIKSNVKNKFLLLANSDISRATDTSRSLNQSAAEEFDKRFQHFQSQLIV